MNLWITFVLIKETCTHQHFALNFIFLYHKRKIQVLERKTGFGKRNKFRNV